MDAGVDQDVNDVEQEDHHAQQISENDHDPNGNQQFARVHGFAPVIGQSLLDVQPADAGPLEDDFQRHGHLPKTDQDQCKAGNDIWQGGAQDVFLLQDLDRQSLGFRQVHVVFF